MLFLPLLKLMCMYLSFYTCMGYDGTMTNHAQEITNFNVFAYTSHSYIVYVITYNARCIYIGKKIVSDVGYNAYVSYHMGPFVCTSNSPCLVMDYQILFYSYYFLFFTFDKSKVNEDIVNYITKSL